MPLCAGTGNQRLRRAAGEPVARLQAATGAASARSDIAADGSLTHRRVLARCKRCSSRWHLFGRGRRGMGGRPWDKPGDTDSRWRRGCADRHGRGGPLRLCMRGSEARNGGHYSFAPVPYAAAASRESEAGSHRDRTSRCSGRGLAIMFIRLKHGPGGNVWRVSAPDVPAAVWRAKRAAFFLRASASPREKIGPPE